MNDPESSSGYRPPIVAAQSQMTGQPNYMQQALQLTAQAQQQVPQVV